MQLDLVFVTSNLVPVLLKYSGYNEMTILDNHLLNRTVD